MVLPPFALLNFTSLYSSFAAVVGGPLSQADVATAMQNAGFIAAAIPLIQGDAATGKYHP